MKVWKSFARCSLYKGNILIFNGFHSNEKFVLQTRNFEAFLHFCRFQIQQYGFTITPRTLEWSWKKNRVECGKWYSFITGSYTSWFLLAIIWKSMEICEFHQESNDFAKKKSSIHPAQRPIAASTHLASPNNSMYEITKGERKKTTNIGR